VKYGSRDAIIQGLNLRVDKSFFGCLNLKMLRFEMIICYVVREAFWYASLPLSSYGRSHGRELYSFRGRVCSIDMHIKRASIICRARQFCGFWLTCTLRGVGSHCLRRSHDEVAQSLCTSPVIKNQMLYVHSRPAIV
jgi:hypothetical protein